MKTILMIISVLLVITSCNPDHSKIKSSLNERYVSYEIVQITPIKANVHHLKMVAMSTLLQLGEINIKIINNQTKILNGGNKMKLQSESKVYADEAFKLVSHLYDYDTTNLTDCYSVVYKIPVNNVKVQVSEYYEIIRINGSVEYRSINPNDLYDELGIRKKLEEIQNDYLELVLL